MGEGSTETATGSDVPSDAIHGQSHGMTAKRISLDRLADRLQPLVDALETERKTVRNGVFKRAGISIGAGVLVALILVLFGVLFIVPLIAVAIGTVLGVALANWHARGFKNKAATALVIPIVNEVGDTEYSRKPSGVSETNQFFELNVAPRGSRVSYADCLRGRHRDTDFMLVECKVVRRSNAKKSGSSTRTVFNGLLVQISVPVAFDGIVFIGRDFGNLGNLLSGLIKKIGNLQPVAFPDSAFEDHYEVFADNPDTARRLIDPGFAEAMIRIDGLASGGRPRAAFSDGKFYLALPWRGGFMEPVGIYRPIVLSREWLSDMVDEITLPHRLIDTLHGDQ
jgi:hypothetical protein